MIKEKSQKNKEIAVGYCRVSTDDQADQGLSLDYQEEQCLKAAKGAGYKQVEIIRDEGKSGTSIAKRPGMRRILDLAKNREISALFVTHSDRLARNTVEHSFIRTTLRENGVMLNYLNGQSSGDDAASTMADNMFAVINQYHSDNTKEKTKQATYAKARAGYLPTFAPVGYLNAANPDKNCEKVAKRIIIPNPKTGHLVTEAFKLYATGQYNAYELNDKMYEKGLVSNSGKKLAPSMFYVMLKNRIYLGEIHWQDIHVPGKHEPLTDEATFEQAQKVASDRVGKRCRRRKFFWLLNGYMFCGVHNKRYTAEWHLKKGKAYYHCSNRSGCGKYIEKSDLESQVAEKFKDLQFDPGFVESIIQKVRGTFLSRRERYDSNERGLINQKNAWEAKLRVLEERLMDETITKETYTRLAKELNSGLDKVNEKLAQLKKDKDIDIERASEVLGFTRDIYGTYLNAPEALQKRFIDFFFDRFEVIDGVIVKERYSPLFQELVHINLITFKGGKNEKCFGNKGKEKVIINTKLGAVVEDVRTIFEQKNDATIYIPTFYHTQETAAV